MSALDEDNYPWRHQGIHQEIPSMLITIYVTTTITLIGHISTFAACGNCPKFASLCHVFSATKYMECVMKLLLKHCLIYILMCFESFHFINTVNSLTVRAWLSNLAQSLLLIKIFQLLWLSERLCCRNPSVFMNWFDQKQHLWTPDWCSVICICVCF